jgi:hypothetical protein
MMRKTSYLAFNPSITFSVGEAASGGFPNNGAAAPAPKKPGKGS